METKYKIITTLADGVTITATAITGIRAHKLAMAARAAHPEALIIVVYRDREITVIK